MARGNELYGQARPNQVRFDIVNDPRQGFPILAAATLNSITAPHRVGNAGAVYKYQTASGPLTVGGNRNLISADDVVYSYIHPSDAGVATETIGRLILGGGTFWEVAANANYAQIWGAAAEESVVLTVNVQGEHPVIQTGTTNYGAAQESFNKAGGSTIDVANGATTVTGNGTTFTTDTLVGGYGYTPGLNQIVPGDVLGVGAAGARTWYRIVAVNAAAGAGALTIFPAFQQASVLASDYIVRRTGRGSYSSVVILPDISGAKNPYFYYAGNLRSMPKSVGRIQARDSVATLLGGGHFMGPQSVDAAGAPVGQVEAVDIAYYKGYLLYGANGAIGWSVAGFPTAFPFGATDFPAAQLTVVDNRDTFVSFEYLGDQLLALFTRGIWIVQPTGTVPEFNFFRMPEPLGPLHAALPDSEIGSGVKAYGRPTCSGRGAVYYVARSGVMQLSGSLAKSVSEPVDDGPGIQATPGSLHVLSWEPTSDSVIWRNGNIGDALCYQQSFGYWYPLRITATSGSVVGVTGGVNNRSARTEAFREPTFGYYNPQNSNLVFENRWYDREPPLSGTANAPWIWATPIINLSDIYAGFQFGGFSIDAMGASGAPADTLTWSVYGGSSPYEMTLRDGPHPSTYAFGTRSSRALLSKKFDDAFIGVVLTGTKWIQLTGIRLYDSAAKPSR